MKATPNIMSISAERVLDFFSENGIDSLGRLVELKDIRIEDSYRRCVSFVKLEKTRGRRIISISYSIIEPSEIILSCIKFDYHANRSATFTLRTNQCPRGYDNHFNLDSYGNGVYSKRIGGEWVGVVKEFESLRNKKPFG